MDQPTQSGVALPRHVRWFAVWRWRSWERWTLIATVLTFAYFESPVLLGTMKPPIVAGGSLRIRVGALWFPRPFAAPLQWCYDNSRICRIFYEWQADYLLELRDKNR